MAKETVDVVIEGGKATAAPPLGPALGPLKVNIAEIVKAINDKTQALKGMQVPVKVTVDTETKAFEISIGTPPASALLKKAANIKKAATNALTDVAADLPMSEIIIITKTKADALLGKNLKMKTKEIVGTAQSMGINIDGKRAPVVLKEIDEGKYDSVLK
jgi:large subunit ribosomal protein L11